jgi:hypothetical protein
MGDSPLAIRHSLPSNHSPLTIRYSLLSSSPFAIRYSLLFYSLSVTAHWATPP